MGDVTVDHNLTKTSKKRKKSKEGDHVKCEKHYKSHDIMGYSWGCGGVPFQTTTYSFLRKSEKKSTRKGREGRRHNLNLLNATKCVGGLSFWERTL